MGYYQWTANVNIRVARSPLGRYFRLEHSGHVGVGFPIEGESVH